MPQNETFDFAGPAGRLEALLMWPDGPPRAAAVVCHAHPLHGGMMHFKVVFRAAKALQSCGAAVLRFNFRGVGRSEGRHDHGIGEQDDVRAALAEVARRVPGVPLVLGGFSFGSNMALRVGCAEPAVAGLLAMGFPLTMVDDRGFLASCGHAARVFVQGEHDRFGSGPEIEALAASLPDAPPAVVIPGADHFFAHRLDELQTAVASWAAGLPWARG